MIIRRTCSHEKCNELTVLNTDTCARHFRGDVREAIEKLLRSTDYLVRVSFDGLNLSDISFASHTFHGCTFTGTTLSRCDFHDTVFELTFVDFAEITRCRFTDARVRASTFAGSDIRECTFENATLLQVNFNGAKIRDLTIRSSEFLDCRLITADIRDTEFSDCNLKGSDFSNSRRVNVRYPTCNVFQTAGIRGERKYAAINIPGLDL
ncbi:MAG: pentapeptide repeat-containing protein [Spirochaetota bacterium]